MFPVINKQLLSKDVKRLDIRAEHIAGRIKPGQFVMVIPEPDGKWVPFSVVECDRKKGTITLIVREVGPATQKLGEISINETIFSILGPLGKPASIQKEGLVVCVSTGIGTAQILPICRAFKEAGNKVIGVIGAKTKRSLMLESQMRLTCHKLSIATEDGSYEKRGLATQLVKKFLDTEPVSLVYAIGSEEMMQEVGLLTSAKSIRMRAQLDPMMFCGFGVCGSCRVKIDGKEVLACQEGPEFDGHQVDFADLRVRVHALREAGRVDLAPTSTSEWELSGSGSWRDRMAGFLKRFE